MLSCISTNNNSNKFECNLIKVPLKTFKIDPFGHIYTIDNKNRLNVYDADLKLLFEYYNNGLGDISYLDITNPRKIILFFSGFQKMVFLDNTLSEIGRLNLDFNLPYDIRAMGSSRDNNIWIYDATDYKLKKIDSNGKVILLSNPIESFLNINIVPHYIIEYNNEVYLIEEGEGIAVFDNFGNYLSFVPFKGGSSLSFQTNALIYVKEAAIYLKNYENKFEADQKIKAVPTSVRTAYIFKNYIYYLENNCLQKTIF